MPAGFLRRFENRINNDIVELPAHRWVGGTKTFRLASALFFSDEVSVDDGESSTPEATAARSPNRAGVAEVSRSLLDDLGLLSRPDPTDDNPSHCLILDVPKSAAKQLAKRAKIVLPLPGVNVVEGT